MTEDLAQKMTTEENQMILHSAIRLLWNMVPDDGVKSATLIRDNLMKSSNLMQPFEILGGHCIAEFILNNSNLPDLLQESIINNTKFNLFDHLMVECP